VDPLLDRIDEYCDRVPRGAARAEEFAALVLFVRERPGWPYYARPLRGGPPVTAADVKRVRARERELGLPETFEWIQDVRPEMAPACRDAGMTVLDHPLMVMRGSPRVPRPPDGVEVRLLQPDDDAARVDAIAPVAFGNPGTAVGDVGIEALPPPSAVAGARDGPGFKAVAMVGEDPVGSGVCIPVGSVAEIAGIGVLPAFRRRGIGAAVTALLVAEARSQGVETIFLTAGDEVIARVYASLGFERIGTGGAAEPA
jgi:ribosomal protein S18 acetylase RimI-like enzyme